jgi:hypothetical protein
VGVVGVGAAGVVVVVVFFFFFVAADAVDEYTNTLMCNFNTSCSM